MKHLIFGVIITEPMGVPSAYRSPLLGYPFLKTVFDDGREPGADLDLTISVEGQSLKSVVSGHVEIVGGTVEMFERAIAAIKPLPADKPTGAKAPLPSSFIQLGIGSKEFCEVFVRFWAVSIGEEKSSLWAPHLLGEIRASKPTDVIWTDVRTGIIQRENGPDMMRAHIVDMVM